jgi:hypothetical protein
MAAGPRGGDHVAVHADVVITIILAGLVALAALATGLVLLRIRLRARAAEEDDRRGDSFLVR